MSVTNPKTPKRSFHPWSREARREQRQVEAEARKVARAVRSPQQQLAVLEARGVTSGREVDRLALQVFKNLKKKGDKPNREATQ